MAAPTVNKTWELNPPKIRSVFKECERLPPPTDQGRECQRKDTFRSTAGPLDRVYVLKPLYVPTEREVSFMLIKNIVSCFIKVQTFKNYQEACRISNLPPVVGLWRSHTGKRREGRAQARGPKAS